MKLARRERQDRGALTPFGWGGSPFSELNRIRNEINRIFADPFSLTGPSTNFFEGWAPAVDLYERGTENHIVRTGKHDPEKIRRRATAVGHDHGRDAGGKQERIAVGRRP